MAIEIAKVQRMLEVLGNGGSIAAVLDVISDDDPTDYAAVGAVPTVVSDLFPQTGDDFLRYGSQ